MTLQELLKIIGSVAKENGIHTPYLVGGIPRDFVLEQLHNLNDIDLTTGYNDIHTLAKLMAERLKVEPKIFPDGHMKVSFDRFTMDFSSNFNYTNIDDLLAKKGLKSNDGLVRETFSRDFTIHCLLIPLDFSKIIDLTKQGLGDCESKLLRCPVSCDVSFKASPNRIIRAFYYAAKYDLDFADEVKDAIRSNLDLLKTISPKYASDKIGAALKLRPTLLDDLIELGVLQRIPLTKDISDQLIEQKKLLKVM